jgi:hypothetical protein
VWGLIEPDSFNRRHCFRPEAATPPLWQDSAAVQPTEIRRMPREDFTLHPFAQYQEHRDLVSIYREDIDDHSIQGFVLESSQQLVVLQYVYDFHLDGLMVLRVDDISEVEVSATSVFQKGLLAQEGLEDQVPFESRFELQNWRTLISQLAKEHPLMILECEAGEEKDFLIGRVEEITTTGVRFKHFSGAATWADSPVQLKYGDITCCQVGSNYANFYQRHFERNSR